MLQLLPGYECFQPFHWEVTPLLLLIVNLSDVTEVWKLPKNVQHRAAADKQKKRRKAEGWREASGEFCKANTALSFCVRCHEDFSADSNPLIGGPVHTKSPHSLHRLTVLSTDLLNFELTCVKEVDFVCSAA